jgi:hypothetical protein
MNTTRSLRKHRPGTELSVSQLSVAELYSELQRRVDNLLAQRAHLLEQLEMIDGELSKVQSVHGGTDRRPVNATPTPPRSKTPATNGHLPRKRLANDRPLKDILVEILADRPRSKKEVAEAALAAGYQTTSKNFSNNVGVVLYGDDRFTAVDGVWRLVDSVHQGSHD